MIKTKFGVVTVSDSCINDGLDDVSGTTLCNQIREDFKGVEVVKQIVPDELEKIQSVLRRLSDDPYMRVIFTTGGTGFAPRDVTPEATKPILDKECPQLATAITIASLQKTKLAALSRGICGIRKKTIIVNFPGSVKAVRECYAVVRDLLPHAISLLDDDLPQVLSVHHDLQGTTARQSPLATPAGHVCPHKTGAGDENDRNSTFPMLPIEQLLNILRQNIQPNPASLNVTKAISPVNVPPFLTSMKDGYAMKSSGFSGTKKVIGYISAGDAPNTSKMQEDECFKINTGAPVPMHADCVIQIEDTKVLKRTKSGHEDFVEIIAEPKPGLDIRPIGCDVLQGSALFPISDHSPVVIKSVLASVGQQLRVHKHKIAIISTGSELLAPNQPLYDGKTYDSNTTMLEELLSYFGFDCMRKIVLDDEFSAVSRSISELFEEFDIIVCTGGVSMGDKDFIKPALKSLGFTIHCGRVNMKPGKPMTYATKHHKHFFGLPGNPVSAFVTFHLFVLPAIRWADGWDWSKCILPVITVTLRDVTMLLDPRPEFARASVTSKNGILYATITGDQLSSRLQSIVGADVLVHLPARTAEKTHAHSGEVYKASILRYDFISCYE